MIFKIRVTLIVIYVLKCFLQNTSKFSTQPYLQGSNIAICTTLIIIISWCRHQCARCWYNAPCRSSASVLILVYVFTFVHHLILASQAHLGRPLTLWPLIKPTKKSRLSSPLETLIKCPPNFVFQIATYAFIWRAFSIYSFNQVDVRNFTTLSQH